MISLYNVIPFLKDPPTDVNLILRIRPRLLKQSHLAAILRLKLKISFLSRYCSHTNASHVLRRVLLIFVLGLMMSCLHFFQQNVSLIWFTSRALRHVLPFLGIGPNRGRSPVEWGDFPSVRTFVRPFSNVHSVGPQNTCKILLSIGLLSRSQKRRALISWQNIALTRSPVALSDVSCPRVWWDIGAEENTRGKKEKEVN